MTYRQHRSHARYAPVAAPAMMPRRRASRGTMIATRIMAEPSRPQAIVGLLYALPPSLMLWAGIMFAAHSLF